MLRFGGTREDTDESAGSENAQKPIRFGRLSQQLLVSQRQWNSLGIGFVGMSEVGEIFAAHRGERNRNGPRKS